MEIKMTGYEQHCLDSAASFSAVRGASPFNRIRGDFETMEQALAFADSFGDGRTMIYAITATSDSAHIRNA